MDSVIAAGKHAYCPATSTHGLRSGPADSALTPDLERYGRECGARVEGLDLAPHR